MSWGLREELDKRPTGPWREDGRYKGNTIYLLQTMYGDLLIGRWDERAERWQECDSPQWVPRSMVKRFAEIKP